MSAFLCDDSHILAVAVLSLYRGESGEIDSAKLKEHVEILTMANHASLGDRYPERGVSVIVCDVPKVWGLATICLDVPAVEQESISDTRDTRRTANIPLRTLVSIMQAQCAKLVDCFEYQACDWRHWEGSDAAKLCDMARSNILRSLPGYDEASWGASWL